MGLLVFGASVNLRISIRLSYSKARSVLAVGYLVQLGNPLLGHAVVLPIGPAGIDGLAVHAHHRGNVMHALHAAFNF